MCRECGSNRFGLDPDLDDEAHVECQDCGHKIGTLAELKERVAAEVLSRSSRRSTKPTAGHSV